VRRKHTKHAGPNVRFARWYRRTERSLRVALLFLRRWFLWVILAVAALAFAIVLFSPLIRVREIRVQRSEERVDIEKIQTLLLPLFGRHLFFLSRFEVTNLMKDAVPDLDTVSVAKNYPSELSVRVTLKPLGARIQIEEPPPKKSSTGAIIAVPVPPKKRFDYLTVNTIYESLPSEDPRGKDLPLIKVVDWSVRPVSGTPLLSEGLLDRMKATETTLKDQFGLQVTSRTVYIRAHEFHLSTGKISLWFDIESPLEEQLGRLRTFLKSVGIAQAKSYIDLRLAGRVVYR